MRNPDSGKTPVREKLCVRVISNPDDFARMSTEWDRLAACLGDRSLFSSHGWLSRSWKRHERLRSRRMHIITIRDHGELVLAAPFVRVADWYGTAKLVPLDSMTTQYNDILVVDDERFAAIAAAFWGYLRRNRRIRAVKLPGVRADSATARLLDRAGARRVWETIAPALDLSPFPDGGAFFNRRSYNTRYNFRRFLRLLERNGTARFRRIDSEPELESAIRWIFARKEAWVEEKFGEPNWVSAEGTTDFFVDMALLEARRGGAFVMQLDLEDNPIAAILAFHRGATTFVSKIAYDPEWKAVSPGWLVTMNVLIDACDRGDRSADLMIGPGEWKVRFSSSLIPVLGYRASNGLFSL